MMSDHENGEKSRPAPDARVLGQILAAQNIVLVLPDAAHIADFYAQSLISIPGVSACRVCFGNVSVQAGEMESGACDECAAMQKTAGKNDAILPANADFKCKLADQPDMRFTAIDSYQHRFGLFVFKINDPSVFEVYEPFLSNLANYVAFFLENRLLEEEREKEQRTLKHLLQASDRERQLVAYEIHDGLAQYLAGALMQFEVYRHLKEAKPKEAEKAYDTAMTMLHQGHFEARRLIGGLRPPVLDESGVVTAVAHLINEQRFQPGPKIEFHGKTKFSRLAPILENAIYRIVQEGLTNACKHSKSKKVRVEMLQHGDRLRIAIQDWGAGFDTHEDKEDRFGLVGIRERVRLLGGNASVESTPGKGTCLSVELPLVLKE